MITTTNCYNIIVSDISEKSSLISIFSKPLSFNLQIIFTMKYLMLSLWFHCHLSEAAYHFVLGQLPLLLACGSSAGVYIIRLICFWNPTHTHPATAKRKKNLIPTPNFLHSLTLLKKLIVPSYSNPFRITWV